MGKAFLADNQPENGTTERMRRRMKAKQFRELVKMNLELSFPGDFFPILGWIGYNSFEKKLVTHKGKNYKFIHGLIEEHWRRLLDNKH